MPVFAGQGDPARSMALLWRTPSARTGPGPKPGLSVDAIVAAAIAVADADGLAGLSMRAGGARILRQAGLRPAVSRRVVSLLFYVARGTAQAVAESRLAAAAGGASEQAWWASRAAALRQLAPDFAQRFPDSAWLASARAARRRDDSTPYLEREAMEAFTVGLTVLLDGIEAAR